MSVPTALLRQLFIRKLSAFVGFTFLLYDYFLTLSLEVAYIWNAPWTVIKIVFLVNRYVTLIGQGLVALEETGHLSHGSERFCAAFQLYLPFFIIFSGETIRFMVVVRACVILGSKRIVAVVWNILYILYALVVLGVVLYFWNHAGPLHFKYLNETGICITPVPPNLWTILFLTIVLDNFILVMIYYGLRRIYSVSRGVYPSGLVRLLIRDAFLFYIATMFNSILCIVCWTVLARDVRNVLNKTITTPLLAIMGQRLVLNLRRLGAHTDSTRDLSQAVARQVAAMETDDEQSDPQSEQGLELVRVGGDRAVV